MHDRDKIDQLNSLVDELCHQANQSAQVAKIHHSIFQWRPRTALSVNS